MSDAVLEVRSAAVSYGATNALTDFSVRLEPGKMTCLLGANGAGKSTALNLVCGTVKPRSGSVVLHSQELARRPTFAIVRAGVGMVAEGRRLFPGMSVEDHLLLARSCTAKTAHGPGDMYEMFPILGERRNQLAGTLSGGEQQMLAIARAMIGRPAVVLLDEPSLGLAPLVVRAVLDTARQVADNGTPVLLAEQNARLALRLADHAIVLDGGRTVLKGNADQLLADRRVQDAYLGGACSPIPTDLSGRTTQPK